MNTNGSIRALRRANPRARAGFAESVEATADALLVQIVTTAADATVETAAAGPGRGPSAPRRRLVRASTVGTLTAAAAERSGTAVVRIDHDGEPWAGTTVRWHGEDLAKEDMAPPRDVPKRPWRAGSRFLLVDGTMYGVDPDNGGWVVLGSPDSIDPDSGTTPDEYLAAVREDVGGATLRRITDGMTGLTTRQLDDGSTVYSGTVAAGLIARETGFKEGESIRVLPFGYVAHDEAANPEAPLRAAVTVGAHGVVREIAATWGSGVSRWSFRVTYSGLGTTPAPAAPANAEPPRRALRDRARTETGNPAPRAEERCLSGRDSARKGCPG